MKLVAVLAAVTRLTVPDEVITTEVVHTQTIFTHHREFLAMRQCFEFITSVERMLVLTGDTLLSLDISHEGVVRGILPDWPWPCIVGSLSGVL